MANISSINGNPIVVDTSGISDGAVTEAKGASAFVRALIKGRGYHTDAGLTDANNAERNSTVTITSKSAVANLPTGLQSDACMLVTIGTGSQVHANSIAFQMCLAISKENSEQVVTGLWYRSRYGAAASAWSTWVSAYSSTDGSVQASALVDGSINADKLSSGLLNHLLYAKGYVIGMAEPYTDADQFARNTIYYYTYATPLSNMPDDVQQGWIITIGDGGHTSTTSVGLQVVVSQAEVANPTRADMYVRSRYGAPTNTWSPWMKVAYDNEVLKPTYGSVSMFESICGIGDSYMAGSTYVNDQWIQSVAKYSWTGALARRNGLRLTNLGAHGGTAYDFVMASDGLTKVLSDIQDGNASDLYIINYGINDSNPTRTIGDRTGGPEYIGSSTDINDSDPTQNANSFWGCVGRIVQSISSASPHSKIVLMTLMRFSSVRYDPYSEAIKDIAEYFGLPCVVIGDDPLFSSSFYNSHIDGNHPTVILYNAISYAFERQLNTAMVEYADYFNDFIGAGA